MLINAHTLLHKLSYAVLFSEERFGCIINSWDDSIYYVYWFDAENFMTTRSEKSQMRFEDTNYEEKLKSYGKKDGYFLSSSLLELRKPQDNGKFYGALDAHRKYIFDILVIQDCCLKSNAVSIVDPETDTELVYKKW